MKSLKESLLADMDGVLDKGDNIAIAAFEKTYICGFDAEFKNNTIELTYNEDSISFSELQPEYRELAILKEIPGKEKIIISGTGILNIRSGVTDKTLKRIESKKPLLLIFRDNLFAKKKYEHTELKNCTIVADMVEFYYPVSFKNCTIKLNSKFIDFKNDTLKSIDDLKGLKLDTLNYNGVVLNIINTTLGKEIYLNKDDDKYMEKIYNVLASVFSEMIKKNRQYSFKIRVGKDWYVTYSSRNDFWYCAYGY